MTISVFKGAYAQNQIGLSHPFMCYVLLHLVRVVLTVSCANVSHHHPSFLSSFVSAVWSFSLCVCACVCLQVFQPLLLQCRWVSPEQEVMAPPASKYSVQTPCLLLRSNHHSIWMPSLNSNFFLSLALKWAWGVVAFTGLTARFPLVSLCVYKQKALKECHAISDLDCYQYLFI